MCIGVFLIGSDSQITACAVLSLLYYQLINLSVYADQSLKCSFFLVCVFRADGGVYSHDHREEKKQIPHR